MKISVLASGSKGNSSYIETSSSYGILIDAGLSGKKILEAMDSINANAGNIRAVVITHDHSDHIKGAGIIARKLNIPVYIQKDNYQNKKNLFDNCKIINFENEQFQIGPFTIEPFSIPHDGTSNHAFNIYGDNKKISHLTDLGFITTLVKQRISGADLMVLESNHDPKMLLNGPYPWELKQRVKGRKGHLSNFDACNVMAYDNMKKMKTVILAHLSEENNDPDLAYELMKKSRDYNNKLCDLLVAKQNKSTEFLKV